MFGHRYQQILPQKYKNQQIQKRMVKTVNRPLLDSQDTNNDILANG